MSSFSVEQEAMAKAAQAVESATSKINDNLRRLDAEVQTISSGWKGAAQRSFAQLHLRWTEQQQKLHGALADMHSALVQTGRSYETQEYEQSGAFSNIADQL